MNTTMNNLQKKELSILIPTYNDDCYDLVEQLARQAAAINELEYEILVADDASSLTRVIMSNRRINDLPHCRFIENAVNRGRAAIRNALMREAKYAWLLFIDADMQITHADYLLKYLNTTEQMQVVSGGYEIVGSHEQLGHNLRFLYEKANEKHANSEKRNKCPMKDFHTSNFLISQELMNEHPLDERFLHYGYEDVLYGKALSDIGIQITHIDNPVGFCKFEDNHEFIKKTEEGLRTLSLFSQELEGYSRLLDFRKQHPVLTRWCNRLYKRQRKSWRQKLCSDSPSLLIFKLYKLGYLSRQMEKQGLNETNTSSKDGMENYRATEPQRQ